MPTPRVERKRRATLRHEGWAGGHLRPLDIRQGDNVEVLSGKDKGKRGVVERVLPEQQRVAVRGVNLLKRHTRSGVAGQHPGRHRRLRRSDQLQQRHARLQSLRQAHAHRARRGRARAPRDRLQEVRRALRRGRRSDGNRSRRAPAPPPPLRGRDRPRARGRVPLPQRHAGAVDREGRRQHRHGRGDHQRARHRRGDRRISSRSPARRRS